ncbi:MAG: type II toxin-antitoxin system CcdA family antitoxin [Candidatus Bathyarchaeota archaeon]|nr:type II toxin-antitoxin system CcdA family antitoxin [Candidatus Bathyarchaeota archaeon]
MRKLISVRIDPKIYQTAREMDFNISKTCENSLKQERIIQTVWIL